MLRGKVLNMRGNMRGKVLKVDFALGQTVCLLNVSIVDTD